MPLTVSLKYAAEILGTTPNKLQAAIKKKKIASIRLGRETRVSIFVLAKLLGTSPIVLLDYLEDEVFGRMLEQADKEEGMTLDEARGRFPGLFQEAKAA